MTGRALATFSIIERNLESTIEMYLLQTTSASDQGRREFFHYYIARNLGLDRKIQIVEQIVTATPELPAEFKSIPKHLRKMKEMRDHLAHRLLREEIEGALAISDAWGNEKRRMTSKELEAERQATVNTQVLVSSLANHLVTMFNHGTLEIPRPPGHNPLQFG